MTLSPLAVAAAIWGAIAVIWTVLTPRDTRGRGWHLGLAAAPLAVIALAWIVSSPALKHSLTTWIVVAGPAVLAAVAIAWAWGSAVRNHGVMDICYPAAPMAAAGAVAAVSGRAPTLPEMLLLALLTIGSVRLIVQTWGQNHHAERQPYAHWRKRFGPQWIWWSVFQVHLLQGVTIWIWCAPIVFALTLPQGVAASLVWTAAGAGAAVWLGGFLLQREADRQLAAFKDTAENRGRLLDTGVWAWVRHPNYLGETVMWAGWCVFALAHPWGWLTIPATLFTGWFMGYASAAPFKEAHMARTRGEAWTAYCARTPRFIPWPRPRAN